MKKTFPAKKLFIALAVLAGLFLILPPTASWAADPPAKGYAIEIALPNLPAGSTVSDPGAYISYLFVFGLSLAGFLAVGAIAWGGIQYMIAGTGTSMTSIGKAKEMIFGALSGIVLLLCSYLILFTIDPSLVNLTPAVPRAGDITAPPETTAPCAPETCQLGFTWNASSCGCEPDTSLN